LKKQQPTIFGDGSKTRDYTFVSDVVEANIKALAFDKSDYFNISMGAKNSVIDVFNLIEENLKTGLKPIFGVDRMGDAMHSSLDPAKAKEKLHWEPETSLKQGIKKTLDFYLNK